jgi:hypothetical protein
VALFLVEQVDQVAAEQARETQTMPRVQRELLIQVAAVAAAHTIQVLVIQVVLAVQVL